MTFREIPGLLLVGSSATKVRGTCNRTGKPIEGAILVVDTLGPELYAAIVTSSAVICARGGRTGHMQSLCRARGIPVLRIDAQDLDALGNEVTILLDHESVILGDGEPVTQLSARPVASFDDIESICVVITDATDIRSTNTIAPPVEQADSYFAREEFICLSSALSPIDSLRAGVHEAERYGAALASELCSMLNALLPGQRLVMRLLDLRSDDAAKITTGAAVDTEPNPELGFHGARWLLAERHYPVAFKALRVHVRERLGTVADQLSFAVPFINDQAEFLRLRQHLGLTDDTPWASSSRHRPPYIRRPTSAPPEPANCSSAPKT